MDDVHKTAEEGKLVYELAFHILPTISDEGVSEVFQQIRSTVEGFGGSVFAEEAPKHIHLAYTMSKEIAGKRQRFDTAHFGWVAFELGQGEITKVKDACDVHESILRFLITKTTKENAQPRTRGGTLQRKLEDEDKTEKVSEEELDKTIDELVA